jgi:hypothetical protein
MPILRAHKIMLEHFAIHGTWGKPGDRKAARGWKKLYKRCLPTPWVKDYWR